MLLFQSGDFHERKAQRTEYYNDYIKGWRKVECTACGGSGHYDADYSPECDRCDGTGKTRRYFNLDTLHPFVGKTLKYIMEDGKVLHVFIKNKREARYQIIDNDTQTRSSRKRVKLMYDFSVGNSERFWQVDVDNQEFILDHGRPI